MGRVLDYMQERTKRVAAAIQRLKDNGAKTIVENGLKKMYLPGNVRIGAYCSPKDYGQYVAANKRTHKQYLRHHKK